ncbi:ABC transporter ATP-binding protein [Leucobacter massiliensis]|uniref:ABC transporter ATP-binding protein n=1 Tax=Leucobacter massiliensis TaxID=1686285 RepID=A0A2S9QR23_9MICO|nr:ABC transporter ATP-binding protein [Leucobacter massiliensis]PRI12047.1 ABC transporter ATP-binding protein [Leucobacter massiliensis]
MAAPVIEVQSLVKHFGKTRALDGLDLRVEPGTVTGFLGPNGSGKSTTIRILLGLIRADEGALRLFGGDPWRDAVSLHGRLAYVPGEVTLWRGLTGGEAIDVLSSLRGQREPDRIRAFADRFDLDLRKKARAYSKGNRQKVALVAALASRAELLILDEPTSGLDPVMEAVFGDCVRELQAEGRTVLLSSHILAEVQQLCDTATIIKQGRTVDVFTIDGSEDLPAIEARFLAHYRGDGAGSEDAGAGPGSGPGTAPGSVPAPGSRSGAEPDR